MRAVLCLVLLGGFAAHGQTLNALVGKYRREPVENPWHEGEIRHKPESNGAMLEWVNKAGSKWNLMPDLAHGVLKTDSTNPYFAEGGNECVLHMEDGKVTGFTFRGDLYLRLGGKRGGVRLPQKSGGLKGYISMDLGDVPAGYGYGVSFYVATWPLLEKPLAGFQVGLPSTWILPDNNDFEKPLCPPGTFARDNWPERGPFYRDVFQTIEGGLGFWVSTQFASATSKYRINGTPNGYNHEISSPGWGFGGPKWLAPNQLGIAQLSNRLLVPPDGLTFKEGSAGELLGNAWMALPLVSAHNREGTPTGEQCWTLFFNAANFKGPVAFWIPDIWSQLSQSYHLIDARGLDARPGLMGGGAMEVNTVPMFEAKDAKGTVYSKVPKLQFPVNEQGETVLMQDVVLYSEKGLFNRVKNLRQDKRKIAWQFNPKAEFRPELKAEPISFHQGDGEENIELDGFGKRVQTAIFDRPGGGKAFGLKWKNERGWGRLPEYFRQEGDKRMVIGEAQVPKEVHLLGQSFRPAGKGEPYISPENAAGVWKKPGAKSGPFTVTLTDGSVVTYAWYRFIDQPSIVAQKWTEEKRNQLQALVERLHGEWAVTANYMPAPTSGTLSTLDAALRVEPPQGLEAGYVPIVLRQEARP
ncbi:hypothetical protein [Prosthecobacter sp.]|uniref:hypothetical protein n=1 Tax=Prosthecobacter sp. TaxID=1965333 RepID=UPI00378377F9